MKAAIRGETGLVFAELEIPRPKPTEILVKVRASSLNRADLSLVDGKAHGAAGGTGTPLGLEWSGMLSRLARRSPPTRLATR
jgi:NADPH2:quinone reductase